ncbi:Laccase-3 [Sarracenia purpurea var. burkii]
MSSNQMGTEDGIGLSAAVFVRLLGVFFLQNRLSAPQFQTEEPTMKAIEEERMETHRVRVDPWSNGLSLSLLVAFAFLASFVDAEIHYHNFVVEAAPVKRLCRTHNIITVNGQYPGPTLEVRDGDALVIKVTNNALYNVTIHWHGVQQLRNPWADGPAYVTQCPIQLGSTYTYRFTIENLQGTLWWHAHSKWLRATVYGALIIYPKLGASYPFQQQPKLDIPILLGEWWNRDPIDVLRQATFTGAAPNVSDAYTINGQPGDLYRCSRKGLGLLLTILSPLNETGVW